MSNKMTTIDAMNAVKAFALLAMQMARENDFKKLLFKAVAIYKIAPVQEMINKYEQDS